MPGCSSGATRHASRRRGHRSGHAARQLGAPGARHVRLPRPGAGLRPQAGQAAAEGQSGQGVHGRSAVPRTSASSAAGATASGTGSTWPKSIDDTEATNWASLGSPIAGKQVTVRLDPSEPPATCGRIQVSAMLRHRIPAGDPRRPARRAVSRRCASSRCSRAGAPRRRRLRQTADFQVVFTSPADAFPAGRATTTGTRPDHPFVRHPTHPGDARAAARADQPVHGNAGTTPAIRTTTQRTSPTAPPAAPRTTTSAPPSCRSSASRARPAGPFLQLDRPPEGPIQLQNAWC